MLIYAVFMPIRTVRFQLNVSKDWLKGFESSRLI
jgi:hypothetical protein